MSEIEEVAKTTGKAIDAAREAGGFLAPLIKRPLKQAIGIFEDWITYVRWERLHRLTDRGTTFLRARGATTPTRTIPLKIAIPIMREGSLEEDDELQDIWAQLLANAADASSGVEVQHAFLSILKDLSSLDARVLRLLYSVSESDAQSGIWTGFLPDRIVLTKDKPTGIEEFPPPAMQLVLGNLGRLGLISSGMVWGGGSNFKNIYHTALGREFFQACSGRNRG